MASTRPTRSKARREQQRELFYPGSSAYIWPQPKEQGWARVPRNIGLILTIIDSVKKKGIDVGRTYLDLLASNMDEGLVQVNSEHDFALRAGFSGGDRGVRSWQERLSYSPTSASSRSTADPPIALTSSSSFILARW